MMPHWKRVQATLINRSRYESDRAIVAFQTSDIKRKKTEEEKDGENERNFLRLRFSCAHVRPLFSPRPFACTNSAAVSRTHASTYHSSFLLFVLFTLPPLINDPANITRLRFSFFQVSLFFFFRLFCFNEENAAVSLCG